jgi:hypothetical protein
MSPSGGSGYPGGENHSDTLFIYFAVGTQLALRRV